MKNIILKLATGFAIIWLVSPCLAEDYLSHLKKLAIDSHIASHKGWLALLHYRQDVFSSSFTSEADKNSFFSTLQGKHDPEGELLATVTALFDPSTLNDKHIICRFPARSAWLIINLQIVAQKLPNPGCKKLNQWKQKMNADKATLIFPSSYLGSASSMFGHLFLRLDREDGVNHLLSNTFNYAALTSGSDTPNTFYGGLITGLPSIFSIKPYYLKLKEYAYMENRNIWEYELKLSKDEVNLLILHLWELDGNIFNYFFIDENCAYRILSIIEASKPSINLTKYFQDSALPSEIVASLNDADMITKTTFRPSAKSRFFNNLKLAQDDEIHIIKDLALGHINPESDEFKLLANERKVVILSLASEYLALLISEDRQDRGTSYTRAHTLIKERAQYQTSTSKNKPDIANDSSPDKGHKMGKFSIQRLISNHQYLSSIKFRYTYHNLLDPTAGFAKGSQIEALKFDFRIEHKHTKLHQLDLIDIKSYSPVSDFFSPLSWNISTGITRHIRNVYKTGLYAKTLLGKTCQIKNTYIYGLTGLSLLQGSHFNSNHAAGPAIQLGILYYLPGQIGKLEYEAYDYLSGDKFIEQRLQLQHAITISTNTSIQIDITRKKIDSDEFSETGIQVNYYY